MGVIDINNEEDVARVLKNASIITFGSVRERAALIEQIRRACHDRGYHVVEEDVPLENMPGDNYRFCRDCEGVFDIEYWDYRMADDFS